MKMLFNCVNCGTFIMARTVSDLHLCRQCEKLLEGSELEERYAYLENF